MDEVVGSRGAHRARRGRRALVVPGLVLALLVGLVAGGVAAVSAPSAAAAAPPVPADTTAGYLVYDRTTKKVVESSREHVKFRSASLVKLLIALDFLYQKGTVASVPAADRKLLESMLRSSDDDAASTLWVRGGYEQVIKRMVTRVGLVDTVPPTDRRYWGYTALSAADVVTTYNFLLDRAPSNYRDLIVGNLERSTLCAADGFNQGFGIPRAIAGTKAVKQGWSGYGAAPTGPKCVEGADTVPPNADSAKAPEEAPQQVADTRPATLATPALDLSSRALHTSGLVDARRRVIVVLTLSPKTKTYDAQAATITGITRTLYTNATGTTTPTTTTPPKATTPAPTTTPAPAGASSPAIDQYATRNGAALGPATSATYTVPGGTARDFRAGTVFHSASTGAHLVKPTTLAKYRAVGGPGGVLGFPTTDTAATPDARGAFTHFAGTGGASIYLNPGRNQVYAIYGSIRARWAQLGWERSSVGYPTSDEYAVSGGRRNTFDRGTITWVARTGATQLTTP